MNIKTSKENVFFDSIRNVAIVCHAMRLMTFIIDRESEDLNNDIKLGCLGTMLLDNFSECLINDDEFKEDNDWNHPSNEIKAKALLSFISQEIDKTDTDIKRVLMSKIDWDENPLEEEFLNQLIEKGKRQ